MTHLPIPSEAAITVSGVTKRFRVGDGAMFNALEGVDLTVPRDEVVAILGPSGCGKSTLLNIIANITPADAGQICFDDVPADRFTDWASIGYMFQEDRLLPWRIAIKNVEFSLEAGRMPRAERRERALRALRLVGLSGFENAYPHQLSGGMRSRVALARCLVLKPRILLMDEPFSKLDAQTRSVMHQELLKMREMLRMTVLFVTHDVEESVVLADRVVVMAARPGRVKAVVRLALPRPRDSTSREAAAHIQELRALIDGA